MADLISSDRPTGDRALSTLAALLDTLVPASNDGRMPSAADVDFLAHLERFDADYLRELASVLRRFDAAFADLDLAARVDVVTRFSQDERAAFRQLIRRVYDCYYQDDRVRIAIGATPGAPFPQGNTVMPGDLALLDPVIAAHERHSYRRA